VDTRVRQNWISAKKIGSVSETEQDKDIVYVECLYRPKVKYGLLFGRLPRLMALNDLGVT